MISYVHHEYVAFRNGAAGQPEGRLGKAEGRLVIGYGWVRMHDYEMLLGVCACMTQRVFPYVASSACKPSAGPEADVLYRRTLLTLLSNLESPIGGGKRRKMIMIEYGMLNRWQACSRWFPHI